MAFLVIAWFGGFVCYTGPAFDGWRERRRVRREFPKAKVKFLLPSECRGRK